MTQLCFFNMYHNGDLFHSKPFVRQVMRTLGRQNIKYAHNKDPWVISDIGIESVRVQGLPDKIKTLKSTDPDMFFVNTWIGSYFDKYEGECTLLFNMKMWSDIFDEINKVYNTNLKLGPVEDYMPYVDYRKYVLDSVKSFLIENKTKKALFCNGPALSGQCEYNGDMSDIINECAKRRTDLTFITTHRIDGDQSNVLFTSDIIKSERCDLNEISYLSKFCDYIVGRNSGPFCFASTGENLNDPSKTFYAFGERETDCFTWGIPVKSKYKFDRFVNVDQLKTSIDTLIGI